MFQIKKQVQIFQEKLIKEQLIKEQYNGRIPMDIDEPPYYMDID